MHGCDAGIVLNPHAVVVLIALLQSSQDRDGRQFVRLIDHDRLEAAFQRLVFLEILLVFVQCRRTDGTQFAAREGRLQDVGSIHRTFAGTRTDERVYLVDEEDDAPVALGHLVHHALQPFLELALVFRTGNELSHVERIDLFVLQVLRHVAPDDTCGKSFHDSCLTRSRLTDENRVVFRASRQNLKHAPDFIITPDDRVEFPLSCLLHEVFRVFSERLIVVVCRLRLYALSLPELNDGSPKLFLRDAGIFQNPAGGAVDRKQGEQNRFDADELIAHLLRLFHGLLHDEVGVVRKIRLTALHARQMSDVLFDEHFNLCGVGTELLEKIVRHILPLLQYTFQQVNRFNRLLTVLLGNIHRLLNGFLRLDGKLF